MPGGFDICQMWMKGRCSRTVIMTSSQGPVKGGWWIRGRSLTPLEKSLGGPSSPAAPEGIIPIIKAPCSGYASAAEPLRHWKHIRTFDSMGQHMCIIYNTEYYDCAIMHRSFSSFPMAHREEGAAA